MWNRLSLVSPFFKSYVVQVNTIRASDSIFKLGDPEPIPYFTTKAVGSGPVEDDLVGGILVINYEASLDTVTDRRAVFNFRGYI